MCTYDRGMGAAIDDFLAMRSSRARVRVGCPDLGNKGVVDYCNGISARSVWRAADESYRECQEVHPPSYIQRAAFDMVVYEKQHAKVPASY